MLVGKFLGWVKMQHVTAGAQLHFVWHGLGVGVGMHQVGIH